MKKFNFVITTIIVLSMFSGLFVYAESDQILVGTPILDGVVDDIYFNSLTLDAGIGENAYETEWHHNATGKVYFLYDSNYLYICAEINDDDVSTKGEAFAKGDNPYQNDNCEFRLSLDGGTTTIKVSIDAYGYSVYGLADHMKIVDYSIIKYKTTYTETNYVVECAIPCTEGVLDMISAGKLGFKLQLNDITKDGKGYCYFAYQYDEEGPKGLVYYELSKESAVIEVIAEPIAETSVIETISAPVVTKAPQTNDIILTLVVLVSISSLFITIINKNKKINF